MAEMPNQTTIIGADTHIKGEMTFDGAAKLLGTFEGTIRAKGDLHVAESAACKAVVEAARVTVDGTVEGNVVARDRMELTGKAKMRGDLVATKLLVAEGASFVGHVTVGPDATKNAKAAEGGATMTETKPMSPGTSVNRVEAAVRR